MNLFGLPLFVAKTAPKSGAPGDTQRLVRLAGGALPYRLVRRKRRTIALTVDHEGITAAAPRWVSVGDIEAFIRIKEDWLRKRLAETVQPEPFAWGAGARLAWLGGELELCPDAAAKTPCRDGEKLRLALPADAAPEVWRGTVLAWVRAEAIALFCERAARYAPLLGVPVPNIRLSDSKSQWGSCSANGRVLLCWRLAHLPLALVDYVVAHELAHLLQLNHSSRFWALVARLCPDYALARKELNRLGRSLPVL